MKSTETRYRAYDSAGEYAQSYNGVLKGAFTWAKDCAKSEKGFVLQFVDAQTEGKLVFDARAK